MGAVAQTTVCYGQRSLAGVAFGAASLGWKGFVVGPAILFLAYAAQVALNMFRRRDSTILSTLFLTMLLTNLLIALPFYAHPDESYVGWKRSPTVPVHPVVHRCHDVHYNRIP